MQVQQKILIVITQGIVGGAPLSVLSLARELKKNGHNVTVAFGKGDYLATECEKEAIPTIRPRYLQRSLNPFTALSFIMESKRFIDEHGFRVVHMNSSNALLTAIGAKLSRTKPKTVFTFRGLSFLDEHADLSFVSKAIYGVIFKVLLLFVDESVFVSESNYEKAKKMRLVKTGHVIHNGLDADKLAFMERAQAREELSQRCGKHFDGAFLIGSIGRLVSQKNYEFLISEFARTIQKHPDVYTVIIGEGEERKKLEHLIDKHGLHNNLFLIGEIAAASRYLKAFDLFVLPSRYEGFSMSLTETLFAGVPVLASDVGGAREQFSHAPFQVYPFNNSAQFQERLIRLIENEDVREELAVANGIRKRDFTISQTATKYRAIFKL